MRDEQRINLCFISYLYLSIQKIGHAIYYLRLAEAATYRIIAVLARNTTIVASSARTRQRNISSRCHSAVAATPYISSAVALYPPWICMTKETSWVTLPGPDANYYAW